MTSNSSARMSLRRPPLAFTEHGILMLSSVLKSKRAVEVYRRRSLTTFSMPNTAAERLPIPVQMIERRIYLIRAQKVMLDSDLAELYRVPTRALNQAVRRNLDRPRKRSSSSSSIS